jgi:hypothetical protein
MVIDPPVPPQAQPDGTTATVPGQRNLKDEKESEAKSDQAAATAKRSRFQTKSITSFTPKMAPKPEYESMIFKSAVNNKFADLSDYSPSTFIPDLGVAFWILNNMDHTMASTKRWTDNCAGWVPPHSQMFLSMLLYVQILRAMDSANLLGPISAHKIFLDTFVRVYPLSEIYVPGPLVALFRNLSSFWPTQNDLFGNVSPTLPDSPGWTAANFFTLADYNGTQVANKYLPNISFFISRLRSICAAATSTPNANNAPITQAQFSAHLNGPSSINEVYGRTVDGTDQAMTQSPGAGYIYPDFLQLWINASHAMGRLSIPQNLEHATAPVPFPNTWTSFWRFEFNEHYWFGPVSAMMAKYCQFWNGSTSLDTIVPNCSAAPAVKLRYDVFQTTLHNQIGYTAAVAQVIPPNPNPNNVQAVAQVHPRYTPIDHVRIVVNGRIALPDIPEASVLASIVYCINANEDQADQTASRQGPFWTLGPDILGRDNLESLPGVLSTITRDYHSDTRLVPK